MAMPFAELAFWPYSYGFSMITAHTKVLGMTCVLKIGPGIKSTAGKLVGNVKFCSYSVIMLDVQEGRTQITLWKYDASKRVTRVCFQPGKCLRKLYKSSHSAKLERRIDKDEEAGPAPKFMLASLETIAARILKFQ